MPKVTSNQVLLKVGHISYIFLYC